MAQIPVVYGEWVVKGSLWEFVVNNRKGGRMFLVPDDCTHGELHEMAQEDYGLNKKIEKVELTYSLPDVILQQMAPDTPPMHVTSDRQVRNLIELAKTHFVRLCVSSQSQVEAGVDDDADVSDGDDKIFADEDTRQDTDSEWDEDSNDADDVQATADDVQATVAVDVDDGVNYSDYGKVKDEDSDEDANEMLYDGYKAQFSGGEGRSLSLKDNIYVGQSFASKAELVSKLKSVAVEYKFTF
ncbi:BnaUnng01230D [Brassica napus]|uniref:BnaUnng01230D protein n=1 Tax=Brassica napus TaxID=3708 RepID=A0A078JE21_BRANA|nr:BnaUnng01230D [Brassica napus]